MKKHACTRLTSAKQYVTKQSLSNNIWSAIAEALFGTHVSALFYRTVLCGCRGFDGMQLKERSDGFVSSCPDEADRQRTLVTGKGRRMCFLVNGIRLTHGSTKGIVIFRNVEEEQAMAARSVPASESYTGLVEDGEAGDTGKWCVC